MLLNSNNITYEDRFISPLHCQKPSTVCHLLTQITFKRTIEDNKNTIYIVVRKNLDDNDAKAFYFLGEIQAVGSPISVTLPGEVQAFEIEYELEQPVNNDLYNYITDS